MNYHLELKNVKKSFGPTSIIKGVNLKIRKGEIHSLIGPNGAGKSTLMRTIAGLQELDSGSIITQKSFFIEDNDNELDLKKKTQRLEYSAFPEAIIKIFRFCSY